MLWKQLEPYRPFLILGAFVLGWLVLQGLARTLVRDLFYEIQAPAWTVSSYIDDLQNSLAVSATDKRALAEQVRDLKRLNGAYILKAQHADALAAEIERLEGILDIPEEPGFRAETARVTRRDMNQWWHRITVRKGARDGIRNGAPVIFMDGIVGRVVDVHAFTSEVELVTSPRFRMAANFDGDPRPVTYEGRGGLSFFTPQGTVLNVPSDIFVSDEQTIRLVSSELGGVFPSGLTIGTISRLTLGTDGVFKTGPVQMSKNLLSVEEVTILIRLSDSELQEAPRL